MSVVTEDTNDAIAGVETQYSLAAGDTFSGQLTPADDVDWIAVDLQIDRVYKFEFEYQGDWGYRVVDVSFVNAPPPGTLETPSGITVYPRFQRFLEDPDEADRFFITSDITFTEYFNTAPGTEFFISIFSPNASENIEYSFSFETQGYTYQLGEGDHIFSGSRKADLIATGIGSQVISGRGGDDTIRMSTEELGDTIYGGDGNDIIEIGGGDNVVSGGNGNDSVFGDSGNDTIRGDAGNDTLEGWIGDDSLSGGPGDDSITGFDGDDTLRGGSGDDFLQDIQGSNIAYGDDGNDTISVGGSAHGGDGDDLIRANRAYGGSGDDTLSGTDDANYLDGGRGNDLFIPYNGSDTIIGGDGIDTVNFFRPHERIILREDVHIYNDSGTITVILKEDLLLDDPEFWTLQDVEFLVMGEDTLSVADLVFDLPPSNDTLIGTSGDDTLSGGLLDDFISGLGGDDLLIAGSGLDTVLGGEGDDTLVPGYGIDSIDGGPGIDTLDLSGSTTPAAIFLGEGRGDLGITEEDYYSNIENVIAGDQFLIFFGDYHANHVIGSSTDDDLRGANGNDTLFGRAGNDTIIGGLGDDEISGGRGADWIEGNADNDLLRGNTGNDTIFGGHGDDSLRGQGQSDELHGGAGDDNINGGGSGDTLFGDDGNDFLKGGVRRDELHGGAGNDTVVGNRFDDTLFGDSGNDLLLGGGDADVLDGGSGQDTIKGGLGADVIVFKQGNELDVIQDFDPTEDQIHIDMTLINGGTVQDILGLARITSTGVELVFDDGDILRLVGLRSTDGLEEVIEVV